MPPGGVLLVNLGTPAAPTWSAVRRYLSDFLSDRRVVDAPRWFWLPLLYGLIAPLRALRSAEAYRKVWTPEGSPLLAFSTRLARALARDLAGSGADAPALRLAMRYGQPSIAQALAEFRAAGVRDLVVLPLYPQYSGTTTAAVFDAVADGLRQWPDLPRIRFVHDYHDDPAYLDALAASVRMHRAAHGTGEHLLMSFHGLPVRYVEAGDPYAEQCRRTAEGLALRLGLQPAQWTLCFQSRVGREAWLGPDTEERLVALARAETRRVDVVCPGFAVDCLETLEEIALRGAERFEAAGGERLRYVPALNDGAAHAALLARLIRADEAEAFEAPNRAAAT